EVQKLSVDVEQANQTLVTLDKAKSEFLSIVAHQLRTPLTVIGGYISLLREGAYGKTGAKVEEVFSAIDQNNKKLNQLVDEFLDITRLEEQRLQYVARPLDIRKVIETVVERLVDIAKTKKVKLVVSLPDEPVMVSGDEEKLNHIFDHLIDNAIKYGESGDVNIKMVVDGEGVLVTIKDKGIGVSESDISNLFQKFYRTDNAKRVDANGVGLGLFLCKKFVEAHNGHVSVESPGVDKGTTFNVWLPLKR
ncbi:MAG: HAMP domain-containing sensor histidine kinase, partial [Candidatus Magasanikbacteria bacterium]|nr:HAMP domain-containing sensor histidine kinase [Candidatus Magasanikbacteria bacterium]